jgi:hypothetical protein
LSRFGGLIFQDNNGTVIRKKVRLRWWRVLRWRRVNSASAQARHADGRADVAGQHGHGKTARWWRNSSGTRCIRAPSCLEIRRDSVAAVSVLFFFFASTPVPLISEPRPERPVSRHCEAARERVSRSSGSHDSSDLPGLSNGWGTDLPHREERYSSRPMTGGQDGLVTPVRAAATGCASGFCAW